MPHHPPPARLSLFTNPSHGLCHNKESIVPKTLEKALRSPKVMASTLHRYTPPFSEIVLKKWSMFLAVLG